MSKQLVLVLCGVAAAVVVVAALSVILLPGRESDQAEPPRELRTHVTVQPAPPAERSARADRAPSTAPSSSEANRTEFGDWVLICPEQGSARGCLIGQNHVGAESQRSIFAIQLRRSDDSGVEALLTTPLHVLLQPGVAFDIGQGDPIRIEFNQCRDEQCQASARLSDDVVAKLLTAQRAKATYVVTTGRTATIDVSLDGFSEAFAALAVSFQ